MQKRYIAVPVKLYERVTGVFTEPESVGNCRAKALRLSSVVEEDTVKVTIEFGGDPVVVVLVEPGLTAVESAVFIPS